MSQTIIRNARQVILAVDSSKLDRPAPVRVGNLGDIDWLVTDRAPDLLKTACTDAGVRVVETGVS